MRLRWLCAALAARSRCAAAGTARDDVVHPALATGAGSSEIVTRLVLQPSSRRECEAAGPHLLDRQGPPLVCREDEAGGQDEAVCRRSEAEAAAANKGAACLMRWALHCWLHWHGRYYWWWRYYLLIVFSGTNSGTYRTIHVSACWPPAVYLYCPVSLVLCASRK